MLPPSEMKPTGNSHMIARQRQARILERVRKNGGVRVSDLVTELGVSDMTIRRDIGQLQERGVLEKVHGGATLPASSANYEPGFAAKSALQQREKEAIASVAARLVTPGTVIAIGAGTTTYAMARLLMSVPGLTVVTNSVPVADVLYQAASPDQTILLTGGLRTPSDALVGPFAVSTLRSVHVDLTFVSTHGMDSLAGFTVPNLLEAETNRALVQAGRRLIVLADHSKWGVIGISTYANLDEADVLISDSGLRADVRETLNAYIGELLIAGETSTP